MSIEYGPEVLVPPKHLDITFFEDVLENAIRDSHFNIRHVHITMGSTMGENYLSQIFRARIDYVEVATQVERTLSVIIKSMPTVKGAEFLHEMQVYLKERIIYTEVLPRLDMLLPVKEKFGPRLYHALRLPIKTLVFADLNACQFEMFSRTKGFDEAHALFVVQQLAKLHATSMVLGAREPQLVQIYHTGILGTITSCTVDDMVFQYYDSNADALIRRVSRWPGFEGIVRKLQHYRANLVKKLQACQASMPGELHVLNHGDAWVNNILFRYDTDRNLRDAIFIDFQMAYWGSPGIDLNYFFHTSLQLDVLKHKRPQLIKAYHHTLSSTLTALKHPEVPALEQIEREVQERAPHGFFATFCILPLVCLEKDESADNSLENLLDKDFLPKKCERMFASKIMEERLRYVLPEFEALGIWD